MTPQTYHGTTNQQSDDDLLNAAEIAVRLNCSPRTVARYASDGKLPPPTKIGRLVRWHRRAIDSFLALGL